MSVVPALAQRHREQLRCDRKITAAAFRTVERKTLTKINKNESHQMNETRK